MVSADCLVRSIRADRQGIAGGVDRLRKTPRAGACAESAVAAMIDP